MSDSTQGSFCFFTSHLHICKNYVLIEEESLQISTNVLQEHKTAVKMLFITIPKVPITVHVNIYSGVGRTCEGKHNQSPNFI